MLRSKRNSNLTIYAPRCSLCLNAEVKSIATITWDQSWIQNSFCIKHPRKEHHYNVTHTYTRHEDTRTKEQRLLLKFTFTWVILLNRHGPFFRPRFNCTCLTTHNYFLAPKYCIIAVIIPNKYWFLLGLVFTAERNMDLRPQEFPAAHNKNNNKCAYVTRKNSEKYLHFETWKKKNIPQIYPANHPAFSKCCVRFKENLNSRPDIEIYSNRIYISRDADNIEIFDALLQRDLTKKSAYFFLLVSRFLNIEIIIFSIIF